MLYFFQVLSLASLALAAPSANLNTKRQDFSCIAQDWNIQQFETFTLPPGGTASPGAPAAFNYTHLSFYFDDPNFNIRSLCGRSIAPGSGTLADGNSYFCDGNGMSFQYFGSSIQLQRTPVPCGNVSYTIYGSSGLSLNCFNEFGGESCETVTQVNVDPAFLTQTGPGK